MTREDRLMRVFEDLHVRSTNQGVESILGGPCILALLHHTRFSPRIPWDVLSGRSKSVLAADIDKGFMLRMLEKA